MLSATEHRSLSAWVNFDTLTPEQHFLTLDGGSGYLGLFFSGSGGGSFLRCTVRDDTSYQYTPEYVFADVGSWSHVACVWDGTEVRLYLNGQDLGAAGTSSTLVQSSTAAFVGGANAPINNYWLQGKLDDIRLYRRALTVGEVLSLFAEGGWSG